MSQDESNYLPKQLFTQSMENLVSVQGNSTIGLNGVLLKGVGAIE